MSLRRICGDIIRRNMRFRGTVAKRFFATESTDPKDVVDLTAADEQPLYSESEDPKFQEQLARKRNKSRLNPQHRNILMGVRPYDKPVDWFQNTVRYKKRMLGRYGFKGNDEPVGFAWPTPEEIKDTLEYERVAFPLSLQERWKKLEEAKQIKAEKIKAREAEIADKLSKVNQWMADLDARVAKKEAELEAARLRKEHLVEEIRRHFGFKISPHDERFKTMLAQKEKEEKKKKKEAKKKAKENRFANMIKEISKDKTQEQATDSTKLVE